MIILVKECADDTRLVERSLMSLYYYNSVISASSVVDYPYLDHLFGGIKKSQFLSEFTSDQSLLVRGWMAQKWDLGM